MQKVQDKMLAEVQGWCRGGAGAVQVVQGGCRRGAGGAGGVQATCTVCTSASIISGAGRCRGSRHTSGVSILTVVPVYTGCSESTELIQRRVLALNTECNALSRPIHATASPLGTSRLVRPCTSQS